jgi:hypothetical protein
MPLVPPRPMRDEMFRILCASIEADRALRPLLARQPGAN